MMLGWSARTLGKLGAALGLLQCEGIAAFAGAADAEESAPESGQDPGAKFVDVGRADGGGRSAAPTSTDGGLVLGEPEPELLAPCPTRQGALQRMFTFGQRPTAITASDAAVYVAAGHVIFRAPLDGGCASQLYAADPDTKRITDIKADGGRLYLLARAGGWSEIRSVEGSSGSDERKLVSFEGRWLAQSSQFHVRRHWLYYAQMGAMARLDLRSGESSSPTVRLEGEPESLSITTDAAYWVTGGRMRLRDIDPWVADKVVRWQHDRAEPEVFSDFGCRRVVAREDTVFCLSELTMADSQLAGTADQLVRLGPDGTAGAPIRDEVTTLAIGDVIYLHSYAGELQALPLDATSGSAPLLRHDTSATHLTAHGQRAFFVVQGASVWSLMAAEIPAASP